MTARPLRSIESIDTPRLTGLRVRSDDFAELVAMGKDAVVMATLGGVRTEQQTRESLDKSIEHWNEQGYGFWIFRDKTNGKTVGRFARGADRLAQQPDAPRASHWARDRVALPNPD